MEKLYCFICGKELAGKKKVGYYNEKTGEPFYRIDYTCKNTPLLYRILLGGSHYDISVYPKSP